MLVHVEIVAVFLLFFFKVISSLFFILGLYRNHFDT